MSTRKNIRDQIKARLVPVLQAGAYDLDVFTFQKGKASGRDGFVCLFFERGNTEPSMGDRTDNADLVIQIMMADSDHVDDSLDEVGELIESAVDTDPFFGGALGACSLNGWAYQRETIPGWTGLRLTYTTQFDA
jgi:hypothetical protein